MAMAPATQIDQLKQFPICQVSDALGPTCLVETALNLLDSKFHICGRAFTVKCAPNDNLTLHHALHLAEPRDVLVVESGIGCSSALWGELMSISATTRRLAGTVIDGAARDRVKIQQFGYPVFARRFAVRKTRKEQYGAIQCSVRCGQLTVNPGDILLGDADGILAISPEKLQDTLALTIELARKEDKIEIQIESGKSIFEILGLSRNVPKENALSQSNSTDKP